MICNRIPSSTSIEGLLPSSSSDLFIVPPHSVWTTNRFSNWQQGTFGLAPSKGLSFKEYLWGECSYILPVTALLYIPSVHKEDVCGAIPHVITVCTCLLHILYTHCAKQKVLSILCAQHPIPPLIIEYSRRRWKHVGNTGNVFSVIFKHHMLLQPIRLIAELWNNSHVGSTVH